MAPKTRRHLAGAIISQSGRNRTTFDEDNLVANAGLLAPGALAQKLGVAELIDQHLTRVRELNCITAGQPGFRIRVCPYTHNM
jgi:hypothetical protein